MRHGNTFTALDAQAHSYKTWVVTNPIEETPEVILRARPILNEHGILGPESFFYIPHLKKSLDQNDTEQTRKTH